MRLSRTLTIAFVILGLWLGLTACGDSNAHGHPFPPPSSGSSEYLFATSDGKVWSFTVDANTGALGSAKNVAGPNRSYGILADPAGKFLYVSDAENDTVEAYSISSSGTLSKITGSPFTVGTASPSVQSAAGLAMDSAGKFLYVTDFVNNAVAAFTVDSSTGALTSVGTPYATGDGPAQVVVDASNKYVYVSNFSDVLGGVSAFSLNSTTGALAPVPGSSPFTTLLTGGPFGVAAHGSFVYVAEQNVDRIVGLSISSTTGGLSTTPGSPFTTGSAPTGVTLDPAGKFLYAANNADSTISAYTVDGSTGTLTAMSASPFAAGSQGFFLAVDPSSKFLYATNPDDDTITGFTIDSTTGALTQFSGSATSAGTNPVSVVVANIPN